ncbi:DUF2935 domain-containing protein [Anaerocolumna sp. MB42-C2]|uniref:DUF2935 domain-containing protein n=1 Tax=Anaerocolumna sp. MB42-C2 TaxID=3070997 RepID=UPI0027E05600|nr:DUF2935 domain-containing protein [Anaerocolumna sp. MB42-C2]WMJ88950.1 DUF2935 domain-containing protein [Anaerocolumna sp. MB42-C2]
MVNIMFTNEVVFEHRFWLQILGDHARFIFYSLAPNEIEPIKKAKQYMDKYDELLAKAREQLTQSELDQLNQKAYELTYEFRKFKLELMALTLTNDIKVHLPTSFYNHMINELEEYILVLVAASEGENPIFHPIHYHLRWLSDAVGHAASVAANMDEVEKDMIEESTWYEKEFTDLFMKSVQVEGYLRTGLDNFPSLERLNEQTVNTMVPFMELLEEIMALRTDGRLLGTLMPLMADHMAREECYYLRKLSQIAKTAKPDCDPAKPRIE